MNKADFDEIVKRRVELITSVLTSKGKEYGAERDTFANFKESVGLAFANTPEKVGWEFMTKHLWSIKDMIEKVGNDPNNLPTVEMVEEKLGDAIIYLVLIEGMLKERINERVEPVRYGMQ
jgi:hypothetical protein